MRSRLLLATVALTFAPPTMVHPPGYVCVRTDTPPAIDGQLDDSAWKTAAWSEEFGDMATGVRPGADLRTRVKMVWDDSNLYIAADIAGPDLWAEMTRHDAPLYQENAFEFFIDPDGDNHEYYEFEINALGTFWDLFLPKPYKDDGKAMDAWEIPGLKSAVFVDGTLNDPRDTDRGWSVEIAFPWRVLAEQARRPAPPAEGDQWRVNFSRVQWPFETTTGRYVKPKDAREDNWVWSPQHVVDMHRPELWGYVQFTSRAPGAVTFVPDRSWPARAWLHRAYYAQREYRNAHGRFAATIDDLKLGAPEPELAEPTLQAAGSVFEAHVSLHRTGERWHIRQDALVWRD
jgi:hypothetical protein